MASKRGGRPDKRELVNDAGNFIISYLTELLVNDLKQVKAFISIPQERLGTSSQSSLGPGLLRWPADG